MNIKYVNVVCTQVLQTSIHTVFHRFRVVSSVVDSDVNIWHIKLEVVRVLLTFENSVMTFMSKEREGGGG